MALVASALAEVSKLLFDQALVCSGLSADRGAATAANTPPKRQPDAVIEEKTSASQAALYRSNSNILLYLLAFLTLVHRLSGDYNPLHVSRTDRAIYSKFE